MFAGAVQLVRRCSSTDRSVKNGCGELGYSFVEFGTRSESGAQVHHGFGAFVESLDVFRQQEMASPTGAAGVPLLDMPSVRWALLRLHASYTRFNAGGVNLPFGLLPKLEDERMQGNEWAVGLGYGYHWILSRHWSLEAELGLGYSFVRLQCL